MGALDQPAPAVTTDAGSNPGVQEAWGPPPPGGYVTIGVPTVVGTAPAAAVDAGGFTFTGGTCDASGNCVNPNVGDGQVEQFQKASIVEANSAAEANLVIGKDAEGNVTHTWNKPVDASNNYQLAVFVDNSVKDDPAQVLQHLNIAKSELENGDHVKDGQKVTFNVADVSPTSTTTNSDSDAANRAKDKQAGDPDDKAPTGGGKGGGCNNGPMPKPADDDPAEQAKAEEARKAAEKEEEEEAAAKGKDAVKVNDKAAGAKTLGSEVKNQIKENGGISPAYMSRLANQVYDKSPMYSFISNHMADFDLDGDGEISEAEMKAGMEKYKDDPEFQNAQKDHASRIGENPELAELNTAKGMAGLYNLKQAGESVTNDQVNKAFSPSTQSAISDLVISQEMKNAKLDQSTALPESVADRAKLLEAGGAVNNVLYKLLNGKEKTKS